MSTIHKSKVTVMVWAIMGILPLVRPWSSFAGADTPMAGQMWKEPVTGMEFVWVPEGCYEMGCGNWASDCTREEKPAHEVCVDGFWLGKTEVTQGQWTKVMGENPSRYQKGDNYPVENVFWGQTREFAEKLSALSDGAYEFRLPTEAEWEYACRSGGKPEKYAGGKDPVNNDIFSQLSPSYENRQVPANFVSNPIEEVSRGVKNYRSGKNVLLLSECEDGKNKNESYSFPANNLVMWHHFFTPI